MSLETQSRKVSSAATQTMPSWSVWAVAALHWLVRRLRWCNGRLKCNRCFKQQHKQEHISLIRQIRFGERKVLLANCKQRVVKYWINRFQIWLNLTAKITRPQMPNISNPSILAVSSARKCKTIATHLQSHIGFQ